MHKNVIAKMFVYHKIVLRQHVAEYQMLQKFKNYLQFLITLV